MSLSKGENEYEGIAAVTQQDSGITKNACYEDPAVQSADDGVKGDIATKCSYSYKCAIASGLAVAVVALGLVAACTGFGVEIGRLKSSFNPLHQAAISSELNNAKEQEITRRDHITSLQKVLESLSEKLDNITMRVTTLDQEMSQASSRLDNVSMEVTTLDQEVTQAVSSVSSRLDNVSMEVTTLDQEVSQAGNAVSSRLDNITMEVTQDYTSRIRELATSSNLSFQQIRHDLYTIFPGLDQLFPASSCSALPPSSPSGYYWIRASNSPTVRVYCDMTTSYSNITGGWMRVAHLDMTNASHQCPSPFREHFQFNTRRCVRNEFMGGCSSISFSTFNVSYRSMYGRIIGYQFGSPEAFLGGNIDSVYVDGVSLTRGSPREHIWTFAVSRDRITSVSSALCPCNSPGHVSHADALVPAFVENYYFCDSGSFEFARSGIYYYHSSLWDGRRNCRSPNTCCSFNTPPWFFRQLPQPTSDDIELRLCRDNGSADEDIAIETIDILVQ